MSKKIKMLRDVTSVVDHLRRKFAEGRVYNAVFAAWLPEDSYEWHERKPYVAEPNEITVEYDG